MSQYYKKLVNCEKKLRTSLITKTVIDSPTSPRSQYRLQSYRLLSHAEIEYYIEGIILHKLSIEKNKWKTHGKISNCLAYILAYSKVVLPSISTRLTEISNKNDIEFRMGTVLSEYERLVKRNNGIKEANVIPLLISIGVDYSKISQTLLNNLSSFGKNRGSTAHNSSIVQQLINPSDEIEIVKQIIEELEEIDELVRKIK